MKKSTWIWMGIAIVLIGGGLLYRHLAQDVDPRGATRLMRALEENDANKMRQLLEEGADIHARDKSGQTALFYAARYATDPLSLHKLVAAGADTLAKDQHGHTALMAAAESNPSPNIVLTLARYGRFLEGHSENKNQALAVAAQYNNAEVIKILLIAGANPSEKDKDGHNTVDFLATNTHISEQEKADLRSMMLLLELLEARTKYRRENYPKPAERREPAPPQTRPTQLVYTRPSQTAPAAQTTPPVTTPADTPVAEKQVSPNEVEASPRTINSAEL